MEMDNNNLPKISNELTGKRIKELRKKSGYSVNDLKEILGLGTKQAIYNWQNGESIPSIDNLVILATVFEVKIDDIIVKQPKKMGT